MIKIPVRCALEYVTPNTLKLMNHRHRIYRNSNLHRISHSTNNDVDDLIASFDDKKRLAGKLKYSKSKLPVLKGEALSGINVVKLALESNRRELFHLYVSERQPRLDDERVQQIIDFAQSLNLPIQLCHPSKLYQLTKRQHQGVVLDAAPLPVVYMDEENDLPHCSSKPQLWLLLDQVQDPMHFGPLIRTSFFLGVNRIIASPKCCVLSPTVSASSAGVMEYWQIYHTKHAVNFIEKMKDISWQVIGGVANSNHSANLEEISLDKNSILVIGNEGQGISKDITQQLDLCVSIPAGRNLPNGLDSLSVSAATSILVHHLLSSNKRMG